MKKYKKAFLKIRHNIGFHIVKFLMKDIFPVTVEIVICRKCRGHFVGLAVKKVKNEIHKKYECFDCGRIFYYSEKLMRRL